MNSYEKLKVPGIWFVCSKESDDNIYRYVYDLAVELGLTLVVYSNSSKKEIQNVIIGRVREKCIENTSDQLEREWLEQEMMEYDYHGFFWYPEELNDYVPDGSFWSNYVFFDEFKVLSFTNNFSNLYLIDNLSELMYDEDGDLSQFIQVVEKEAIKYKKTLIVLVSSVDCHNDECFIKNRLL